MSRRGDDDDEPEVQVVHRQPQYRCAAITGRGTPCKNTAKPGHLHCGSHAHRLPGRPSKLTPALRDGIVAAILEGAYLEQAAALHRVSRSTLYRWQERGDRAEAKALEHMPDLDEGGSVYDYADPTEWPYLDFRDALKAAEAFAELELLRMIRTPQASAWQAYMTILERRHPDRWGRRDSRKLEVSGSTASTVRIVAPTDDERARAVMRALAESGALDEPDAEE